MKKELKEGKRWNQLKRSVVDIACAVRLWDTLVVAVVLVVRQPGFLSFTIFQKITILVKVVQ